MNIRHLIVFLAAAIFISLAAMAQQPVSTAGSSAAVPPLVNFTGVLSDVNSKPIVGVTGVTFLLYKDQLGGSALWTETQTVTTDESGRYSVTLGAGSAAGLPTGLFVAGESRWLAVQPHGETEQPRVLLLSVPYALKAGDASTVGGLPASAFMLANSSAAATKISNSGPSVATPAAASKPVPPANPPVTGKGTLNFIPMWDSASDIISSVIFQKTSAIGISTTTPAAPLDVNGKTDIRDTLTLFPKSTDNTLAVSGTSFKVTSTGLVTFVSGQTFPGTGKGTITGVNTATGSGLSGGGTTGTLNLKVPAAGITNAMLQNSKVTLNASAAGGLTAPGAMTLGSTYTIGLKTCAANQVLQFNGTVWNCASSGTGTITGVTAGTDLTGGGTTGTVTLNLDTTKVPLLAASNTFINNQSIAGDLNVTSADYQAATVQSSNGFGTWLALGNTNSGHTWNFLTATSGNAEGAGNLGITDLTGTSTIWLEGYTNITNNLVVTATPDTSLFGLGAISGYGANGDGSGGVFMGGAPAGGLVGGEGIVAYAGGTDTGDGPYAGLFIGDVLVTGEVTGSAVPMRIDHPLDPANKYLEHSAVQSPDMMNIYNGNVVTDASGEAVVNLPDWFETLNRDFRYQLTAIGQQAQAWISSEIANRTFAIKTDKPNVKISWQVTGIRQDAWANAHRTPVELEKLDREKGFYLHPELYGAAPERGIAWARNPDIMKRKQAAQLHAADVKATTHAPFAKY